MKRLILIVTVLFPFAAFAQSSGKIVYEEKTNLHKRLGPDQQDHKEMIPEFQTARTELVFNGEASVYQPHEEDDEQEISTSSGGGGVNIRLRRAANKFYHHYAQQKRIEQRDFAGKFFLIESEMETPEWKIEAEQKSILGHSCQKATFTNEEGKTIVAWFAPSIPLPIGPESLHGLPGAILMADYDKGSRTYQALEIDTEGEAPVVEAPSEGKEMSKEDFDEMVDERLREMGGTRGSGGIRIIRRQ